MRHRGTFGDKNSIGRKVIALRAKNNKMKQMELMAQMQTRGVNIGRAALTQLEGQNRKATAEEVAALADIFHITADELLKPLPEQE